MSGKTKKTRRKVGISLIALLLVAAIGFGIWYGTRSSGETIGVYPFEMVGMTEYWGDSRESYGPVTTDRIQTLFLSDTQTVTEVLVKQGDTVKKGDILLKFDTTLSGLQLERKRLDVEKAKLLLDAGNAELKKIRNMKPMTLPSTDVTVDPPFLGATLTNSHKTYIIAGHDGKSQDTAFICWLRSDVQVDDFLLELLRQKVFGDSGLCPHGTHLLAECPICNCTHGPDCEVCTLPRCTHGKLTELCTLCRTCPHGDKQSECAICAIPLCSHGKIPAMCTSCNPVCEHNVLKGYCKYCCEHGVILGQCSICYCPHGIHKSQSCAQCLGAQSQGEASGLSAQDGQEYFIQLLSNTASSNIGGESYYVIFKVTDGNTELGSPTVWQGAHVQGKGEDFSIRYFIPSFSDYSLPEIPESEPPQYNIGSGMTSAQIAQLRQEQERKVKELELAHKMANAEYQIMLREVGDGNVYAEFDGKVVSLLTEEESKDQKQPMLKLSGGGGFYIEGSISELEKDTLKIGQEVTINDWSTGGTYTGTVKSIGDFPSQNDGWNGMGNPTATYYPFTVFVGEEADLQAGAYVSIQYAASDSVGGIYLQKPFLRTEQGRSYVYVLGADERLEKRYVTTGKSLWGSYVEIRSGLSATDKVAFPYGKGVKEGARAEEKDISELYMY